MKFLLLILIICVAISSTLAATALGVFKDPKHPGKCVVDGLIMSAGEEAQNPKGCGRIFCQDNSKAEFHNCGVVAPPPGYKLGTFTNPKGPYPDCCEREFIPE